MLLRQTFKTKTFNSRYMEENPNAGVIDEGSDNEIEYDEDGNPIAPPRKREIDPLPAIDHSEIEYKPFEKNFYTAHEEIQNLSRSQVDDLRHRLGIRVTGPVPPRPVTSFAHFGFDDALIKAIRKSEYTQPTSIQSQAIPAAMSGRDLIGIAKTGSGKTAAFIWPMLVHIMDQRELQPGDGPIACTCSIFSTFIQNSFLTVLPFCSDIGADKRIIVADLQ